MSTMNNSNSNQEDQTLTALALAVSSSHSSSHESKEVQLQTLGVGSMMDHTISLEPHSHHSHHRQQPQQQPQGGATLVSPCSSTASSSSSSSTCSTGTGTGSTSGLQESNHHQEDPMTSNHHEVCEINMDEWTTPLSSSGCLRGTKCVNLTTTATSANETNTPAQKEKSCVDCGACSGCCDCFHDEHSPSSSPHRAGRVYSIKLGASSSQQVEDLFASTSPDTTEKRAMTLPLELSQALSFNSSADKEWCVKQLVYDDVVDDVAVDVGDDATTNSSSSASSPNKKKKKKKIIHDFHRHHEPNAHSCATKWSNAIHKISVLTCRCLQFVTHYAATYPKTTVALTVSTSFIMLIIGFCTNFELQLENAYLWPPQKSLVMEHTDWYYYNSEFNYDTSFFDLIIHANGDNVLGVQGVRRTFEAIQAVRDLEGYQEGCYWASLFGDEYYIGQCKIHSVADFWNESLAIFEEQVHSDEDVKVAMSATSYPNGIIVDEPRILGKAEHNAHYGADDDEYAQLSSAQSYLIEFDLPWTNVTEDFELLALERIQQLQQEWDADPNNPFRIEMVAYRSYSDEFFRSIIKDLPLLPCVFFIMLFFTCFVFWKPHKVESRCLVGVGAVVCIGFSIMTGYGLLFMCGVPFTPVTTMLPFLMFGIGLDDSFIIYGSYNRTDPRLPCLERLRITMDDIGLSITLTTITSAFAFFTGIFSNIPAVSWVCWYAFPTIVIDFVYQVTFFISLIVLDERRIQANRRDICFCSVVPSDTSVTEHVTFSDSDASEAPKAAAGGSSISSNNNNNNNNNNNSDEDVEDNKIVLKDESTDVVKAAPIKKYSTRKPSHASEHFADRFMNWFARQLLKPVVQGVMVVLFLSMFGFMLYRTMYLKQEFNYIDMVPKDSYVKDYFGAMDAYTDRNGIYVYVFFRDVDQSDPYVQDQMEAYVNDLVENGPVAFQPSYFWLRDFREFVSVNNETLGNATFSEQISEFLKDPSWEDVYGEHIVVDNVTGGVTQSRTVAYVDVDMKVSKEGTEMLANIRAVTSRQPINQGHENWPFFTYSDEYHILQFYTVVVNELISTTVMGVLAVSVIALAFIPHWTAVFYVFPFITFLYIDMLGFLQLTGVEINAISYITLVMSIGLMVDYIIHILLRYYESTGTREHRVVETLSTMGASILVGAISTFLGVLLLGVSTSEMINNIFVAFIGLVTFGVLHGLVFLPVVLAMIGPE